MLLVIHTAHNDVRTVINIITVSWEIHNLYIPRMPFSLNFTRAIIVYHFYLVFINISGGNRFSENDFLPIYNNEKLLCLNLNTLILSWVCLLIQCISNFKTFSWMHNTVIVTQNGKQYEEIYIFICITLCGKFSKKFGWKRTALNYMWQIFWHYISLYIISLGC